jgi:predicted SnoaL-like aldol condensation-catalyzing enzyme
MSSASQPLTATEQNKLLVIRWFEEVWNHGRRETIFELLPESAIIHDGAEQYCGPEEFARFHDSLRSQFSNFKITPIISLAEGEHACVHWSCSMIHTATQKALQLTGTSVVRIENGRFAEAWQNWDAAHLYAQLTGRPISFS